MPEGPPAGVWESSVRLLWKEISGGVASGAPEVSGPAAEEPAGQWTDPASVDAEEFSGFDDGVGPDLLAEHDHDGG